MKLTFLGTGTSQGVPVITCDCPVCRSENPRDKRLRASVLIETGGKTFVVDTGPDFRQQMLREDVKTLDAVLFTHRHKDHTAGMDDVRSFNFKQKRPMPIYADALTLEGLRMEFAYIFNGENYPGVPKVEVKVIDDQPFMAEGLEVTPVRVFHHRMPVLGFRLDDFAYVTDANRIPPESMARLQGLDVLVLNALRREKHLSHFTLDEALEVITELKPRRAYLTHISHLLGLHDEVSAELPENVFLAYDGLIVEG